MIVEFRQGVPAGCVNWLWANVGEGNLQGEPGQGHRREQEETDIWFYERIAKPITPHAFGDDPFEYVPTITVKDEKLAMLFALRWSGQ